MKSIEFKKLTYFTENNVDNHNFTIKFFACLDLYVCMLINTILNLYEKKNIFLNPDSFSGESTEDGSQLFLGLPISCDLCPSALQSDGLDCLTSCFTIHSLNLLLIINRGSAVAQ